MPLEIYILFLKTSQKHICKIFLAPSQRMFRIMFMQARPRHYPLVQQVDQFGRPYEAIWFPPGQEESAETSPRTSSNATNGAGANIDTRLLADGPVYANAPPMLADGRKVSKLML